MKKTSHIEKLKILVALNDKLWEDYENTDLPEKDYILKYSLVKKEISSGFISTMSDLDKFAKDMGYLILRSPTKAFNCKAEKIIINEN
jgi:hypothetical protein